MSDTTIKRTAIALESVKANMTRLYEVYGVPPADLKIRGSQDDIVEEIWQFEAMEQWLSALVSVLLPENQPVVDVPQAVKKGKSAK